MPDIETIKKEWEMSGLVKAGCGSRLRKCVNDNTERKCQSQYISALLMIGPALKDGLTLHLSGEIISRPYINLTLQLMQDFGAKAA